MAQVGPTAALDFSTTDYLSLRRHPCVASASLEGGSGVETILETELAEFLHMEHVFVARSEWGAGVGAIATVVQGEDHVIFDARVRPCLRQGASSVTRHVHRAPRVDAKTVRDLCTEIRSFDAENEVLVVTSSFFANDSEAPDLSEIQATCREYGALLLVDVTDDLGATGPRGEGQLGTQNLLGGVDLVVGSFSRTFAAKGGFLASRSARVRDHVEYYANKRSASRGSPLLGAAVIRESLRIVRSPEGDGLRLRLDDRSASLRAALLAGGIATSGGGSPIVVPRIPSVQATHLKLALERNRLLAELVVLPAGDSILRLHCQTEHTTQQVHDAATLVVETIDRRSGAL